MICLTYCYVILSPQTSSLSNYCSKNILSHFHLCKSCNLRLLCFPPSHPVCQSPHCFTWLVYSISYLFLISLCFLSENEPPVLQSMPFHLRSFQGENFIYQLQARDPEGSLVLFTLESGPEGASLSPAGLLMWKATAETTDTHTLQFIVTDDCNAETRASVQVILSLLFICLSCCVSILTKVVHYLYIILCLYPILWINKSLQI